MDSFLSNLYRENMEKRAGVELKEFYDSLSVEQLEQVLGLTKVAAGEPELPDDGPVREYLDATEKAPAKKTTPPELPDESTTPSVNNTAGIESGKQLLQSSTGKPEPTTPFVPREIKTIDDPGLGSRDAESKTAGIKNFVKRVGQLVGGGDVNALKRAKGARLDRYAQEGPAGKKLQELREAWKASDNRAISSERHKVLGARAGLGLAAAGGTAAALHKGKNKNSTVFDQLEGKTAGAEGPLENMLRNAVVRDVKAKVYPVLAGAGGLAAGGAGGYALGHHAGKKSKTAEKTRADLRAHGYKTAGKITGKLVRELKDFGSAAKEQARRHPWLQTATAGGLGVGTGVGLGELDAKQRQAAKGKKSGAEKRAELLITALRAIKDAPEYVKHAAAKYIGERL